MMTKMTDFMIRGRQTRHRGRFRAQGSALTRNVTRSHGSKNLLQRVILYRHKRYYCVREDCRPRPSETIYDNWMFICPYLWIAQFVWARALYGLRIICSAAVDCSGTIRKIHMRKIELDQGRAHAYKNDRFHDQRPLDKAPWPFQSLGVCADAQCYKITWLEELASASNTIQAQEVLLCQGRLRAISR